MKTVAGVVGTILAIALIGVAWADIHYVAQDGQTPQPPYTNGWGSAASNIQDAVNAAAANDTVLVNDGTYQEGYTNRTSGRSRLFIGTAVINVCSLNGPSNTIIKGAWSSDGLTNGADAIRCVDLYAGSLCGFTLTNGACSNTTGAAGSDGGVFGSTGNPGRMVSNCWIFGNASHGVGGGARDVSPVVDCWIMGNYTLASGGGGVSCDIAGGVLRGCTVSGNWAQDYDGGVRRGGAGITLLDNCTIVSNTARNGGGGAYLCLLTNCTLTGNQANPGHADFGGGGAWGATLYSCLLAGNWSGSYGGGAGKSTLYNCTVARNSANTGGGGMRDGTSVNSIVYFNTAGSAASSNWYATPPATTVAFYNSCTTPTTATWTAGNITSNPVFEDAGSEFGLAFVAGDYRLDDKSPCLDAGTNQSWMYSAVDMDGMPRIRSYKELNVDMGAYEHAPPPPPKATVVTVL